MRSEKTKKSHPIRVPRHVTLTLAQPSPVLSGGTTTITQWFLKETKLEEKP